MRADASAILIFMGYRPISDFVLSQESTGVALIWLAQSARPTDAAIDAAALPTVKSARIAAINAECRSRLLARYGPAEEQVSRSIGVYGSAEKTAMEVGIAATVDASNTASNAVISAATEAAVGAVSVSWPVI